MKHQRAVQIPEPAQNRFQTSGKERKRKRFPIGWTLAILIPLLIVSAGLYFFSKLIYGFEYYSPTVQLDRYVELIREQDYQGAMDFVGLKTSEFNRIEEYEAYFKQYYGETVESSVYTERKLRRTEQSRFYAVQINKKAAQEFKLTKTGEKKLYFFDDWTVAFNDTIPVRSVVIHAPEGVKVKVNGTVVSEGFLKSVSDYKINCYENVRDDLNNISMKTYQVDGLIMITSVEAETADGQTCPVTLLEGSSAAEGVDSYLAASPIPADQLEARKADTEKIIKMYAEYIAKERSFSDLAPYIYQKTKLYEDLKEFYNGWFTGHESFGYEDLKFFGMESYDDTHCVVGIEFKYYVMKKNVRYDYEVKYYAYLLKVNDQWLLADISISKKE